MGGAPHTALQLALPHRNRVHSIPDQTVLASNLVTEYRKNVRRNYGKGTVAILEKWEKTQFGDLLAPAQHLFHGHGSSGNGAAMRIAPIAYFCHNRDVADVIELARQSAVVTHTNEQAIIGCQLQALAIHQLLQRSDAAGRPLDAAHFLQQLEAHLKQTHTESNAELRAYCDKINDIKRLLAVDPSDETVANVLGNNCHALYSVPTAIYSFLRSLQPIEGIEVSLCSKLLSKLRTNVNKSLSFMEHLKIYFTLTYLPI